MPVVTGLALFFPRESNAWRVQALAVTVSSRRQ